MKPSKYTDEQVRNTRRDITGGTKVSEAAKKNGIPVYAFYNREAAMRKRSVKTRRISRKNAPETNSPLSTGVNDTSVVRELRRKNALLARMVQDLIAT